MTQVGSQDDFQVMLDDIGRSFTHITAAETSDGMGGKITRDETETAITGLMIGITEKDREIRELGLAIPGNVKFLVKGDVSLNEGDVIKDSSKRWRVVQILGDRKSGSTLIFVSAVLRNTGLDS